MKLYKIAWTAKAVMQLEDIYDYISNESVSGAEKVRDPATSFVEDRPNLRGGLLAYEGRL